MLTFTKTEVQHLLRAWLLVSLMFAIAMTGIGVQLVVVLPFTLLTAGIGFLLHELAHKYLAQSYRCWAEFRANDQMLVIGLLLSITGVIIAAPGGVHIRGATRHQHGKIALAGPLTNVALAYLFLGLASFQEFSALAAYGIYINALLGVFNLIPFPPFDGSAVWQWNKAAYLVSLALAGSVFVINGV